MAGCVVLNIESRLEIIEREVHGIGCYMRIIIGIAIFFCVCICVHYLCFCHPHIISDGCPKPDALGTTITIFGIVITLLVGWQFFSNIKERERIDKIVESNDKVRKELQPKFDKMQSKIQELEDCCEKRKEELKRLVDRINESFDRTSAINETYVADVYKDMLLEYNGMTPEFRYLSHRMQSLIHTSNFNDVEGCNIMVYDMIGMINIIAPITLQRKWRTSLIEDYLTVKHSDKIVDYLDLKNLLEDIQVAEELKQDELAEHADETNEANASENNPLQTPTKQ